MDCYIVDESEGGARLAECDIYASLKRFDLHVEGSNEPRRCRVVWRSSAFLGVKYLLSEPARRLRQTIARFERLLIVERNPDIAKVYRAEIAAAERMLAEIERDRRGR